MQTEFEMAEAKAVAGDKDAQYQVARMYWQGNGVETNVVKAYIWLTKAASQGHTAALYDAAQANLRGIGTPVNTRTAMQLYLKAADQGDPVPRSRVPRFERVHDQAHAPRRVAENGRRPL